MKTLAWKDRCDGRSGFYIPKISSYNQSLFEPKRHERNITLLESLKHTGNIDVYLLNGNKSRLLFSKGI